MWNRATASLPQQPYIHGSILLPRSMYYKHPPIHPFMNIASDEEVNGYRNWGKTRWFATNNRTERQTTSKKDATLVFPHHNQLKWQYQILPSLVAEKCSLEKLCHKRSDSIVKLLTKRGSVDDGAAKSQQPEPAATSNFCYQGQQVTSAPATTTTLRHTDGWDDGRPGRSLSIQFNTNSS